jgi:alpha-beta hydrolase superfamily lysophospholipase
MPEGQARAVVLIVHGMAEHSLRYEPLALRLAGEGIEVWAADARGHGMTAHYRVKNKPALTEDRGGEAGRRDPGPEAIPVDRVVNPPGKGGLLGHCADRDSFFRVVADIDLLVDAIKDAHPELPLFILGHSWGSFLTQAYIEAHGDRLAGCLLSGTRGPGGLELTFGVPLMGIIAFFRG